MKSVLTGLFLLLIVGCSASTESDSGIAADVNASPIDVVNLRMQSYNNHDIDEFMSVYAGDVKIYNYPNQQIAKGSDHLKSIFEPMFSEKNVSVVIHHQIAKGKYVINHETVSYGDEDTEYVSIYEVHKGLIRSVRFIRD